MKIFTKNWNQYFHNGHGFHGNHSTKMAKKGLKALFLESLMKEYKWNLFDDIWS